MTGLPFLGAAEKCLSQWQVPREYLCPVLRPTSLEDPALGAAPPALVKMGQMPREAERAATVTEYWL